MNSTLIKFIDQTIGGTYFIFYRKKSKKPMQHPKKILLIKFWGMGNIIMVLPTIKKIHQKYPKSRIEFITLKQNKGLLDNFDFINNIHYISMDNYLLTLKEIIDLTKKLRNKEVDLLIDFEQFLNISSIITSLINPENSIGFTTGKRKGKKAYTSTIEYNDKIHMVKNFSNLIKPISINNKNIQLEKIKYSKKDRKKADSLLPKGEYKIIGIHPGCAERAEVRRWPQNRYIKYIKKLIENKKNIVIITGSEKELNLCNKIENKINNNRLINICGRTNLPELARIAEKCDVFVANDTGPMHLAASMGTRTIGLFGPNTPKLYAPYGEENVSIYKNVDCSPCISNLNYKTTKCKNPVCMKKIQVKEVYDQTKRLLN